METSSLLDWRTKREISERMRRRKTKRREEEEDEEERRVDNLLRGEVATGKR